MGKKSKPFLVPALSLVSGFLFQFGAHAAGEAPNKFYPTLETPESRPAVGGAHVVSIGISLETLVPSSNPFQSSGQSFRFQVPSSIGIDASYGLFKNWDLGASVAYENFDSRYQAGNGNGQRLDTVTYRAIPVLKALSRYRKNLSPGMNFETEGAVGYARGRVTVSSTDLGAQELSQDISSFVGHLGVGAGLAWTDEVTAHFLVGYAFHTLGTQHYATTIYDVTQSGSFSGLFLKAQMSYPF